MPYLLVYLNSVGGILIIKVTKMRAIKKFKKLMFTVHEIVWWTVSELEDWLYPYKDRLTPEESFQIRVKTLIQEKNYMVEELIQS